MHLLFKQRRNLSLTLLHLTLSEFIVERGNRALHRAQVYHKLKKPDRFEYVRQRPHLLQPYPQMGLQPRCEQLTSKYRIRRSVSTTPSLEVEHDLLEIVC